MSTHYTATGLLDGSQSFEAFIRSLYVHRLSNMSGSSYNWHIYAHYENGVLLKLNRGTETISIASKPWAKCVRGSQDPRRPGDPRPRLTEGEIIDVWENGKWTKQGPWVSHIHTLLENLIERLNESIAHEKYLEKQKELRSEEEAKALLMGATDAWEKWSNV